MVSEESNSGTPGSGSGNASQSSSQSKSSSSSSSASGCGLKEFKVPQWVAADGSNSTNAVFVKSTDPNTLGGSVKFKVSAKFKNECKYCEYRQLVKGYMQMRPIGQATWQSYSFYLGPEEGHYLDPSEFKEDGQLFGPGYRFVRMGHRSDPKYKPDATGTIFYLPSDKYSATRKSGCSYSSEDNVSFTRPTSTYEAIRVHLEFKGRIIDTSESNETVEEKTWTIDFQDPQTP